MRIITALVALFLFFAIAQAIPANVASKLTNDELVRIRCSQNPNEEIFFFFNGTVTAYLGQDSGPYTNPAATSIRPLFKAVGMNVAKCFKAVSGLWYLVGREAMWYINPTTDEILGSWNNLNGESVNVVHVDNDPVMQTFYPGATYDSQVYGDDTILPSDVTTFLNYLNPIQNPPNPAFNAYSPETYYQAAELFKFVAPTQDVFSDKDSTGRTFVSWTRTSKFLPWMKMGGQAGYLLYSFQGSKIPDYTYMPAKVRADIENRVPHYKHAPASKCFPDLAGTVHNPSSGITSWSFFKENFDSYLNGVQFPLATPRQYGCKSTIIPAPDNQCRATATLVAGSSWPSGGQTITQYDIKITNTGSKAIKTAAVEINFATVINSWNIAREGQTNIWDINLWNNIAAGSSIQGAYGVQVTGSPAISVASVTCA
jgi:hypothetical protein